MSGTAAFPRLAAHAPRDIGDNVPLINYITQIQIDFGAVQLLAQECERIGIRRPLVVTDAGVRAAGVLQKALDAL